MNFITLKLFSGFPQSYSTNRKFPRKPPVFSIRFIFSTWSFPSWKRWISNLSSESRGSSSSLAFENMNLQGNTPGNTQEWPAEGKRETMNFRGCIWNSPPKKKCLVSIYTTMSVFVQRIGISIRLRWTLEPLDLSKALDLSAYQAGYLLGVLCMKSHPLAKTGGQILDHMGGS